MGAVTQGGWAAQGGQRGTQAQKGAPQLLMPRRSVPRPPRGVRRTEGTRGTAPQTRELKPPALGRRCKQGNLIWAVQAAVARQPPCRIRPASHNPPASSNQPAIPSFPACHFPTELTTSFPAFSGRLATSTAAWMAAPLLMPHSRPSSCGCKVGGYRAQVRQLRAGLQMLPGDTEQRVDYVARTHPAQAAVQSHCTHGGQAARHRDGVIRRHLQGQCMRWSGWLTALQPQGH